jgi:ADP-dependent NAD(P)H-hydrate dehydratase
MSDPNTREPGSEVVTPDLLRAWPLPTSDGSKYARGQVVVVGGAHRAAGAAMLTGLASLRVGAGRLTLAVADSVAANVAIALPECGVVGLAENAAGNVLGESVKNASADLAQADCVVIGPGLDDADETAAALRLLPQLLSETCLVVLDAFALGALPDAAASMKPLAARTVLTPNSEEAARLLGHDLGVAATDALEIADAYESVVSYRAFVASRDRLWTIGTGTSGLGTSGSGDVLAGAVAGLCARGAEAAQAAVWATHLHSSAGDRLSSRIGELGYLARELLDELPILLSELSH